MSATILSIRFVPELAAHTQATLEQHGFSVITVMDFKSLEQCCANQGFDVAVICHAIAPKVKRAIGTMLLDHCPRVPIIELYSGEPDLDWAKQVPSDSAEELIRAVKGLLGVARGHKE